jgi:hypothetical protein
MSRKSYRPMQDPAGVTRREFFKTVGLGAAAAGGIVLGVPAFGQEAAKPAAPPPPVETNLADFLKAPKTAHSLPGPFPGKVVQLVDPKCLVDDKPQAAVIREMFTKGLTSLTGKDSKESFGLFFTKDDVVGIKINPVGPPLICVKPELVEAIIDWLTANGLPRERIVIWDRFDYMLKDAGYTAERFPGVQIAGLQTMDEEGNKWRTADGRHVSEDNFDRNVYYFAKGVEGKGVPGYPNDEFYLNQHVFAGEYSYFGKLLTQKLTKIINVAVFKNTGNGISMATKNLGYGAICNTGRLHKPLFFHVCTEVLAAPVIRDKLVLNVTDGIRGQYEDGPMPNPKYVYPLHTLYLATDPFALDMIGHRQMVEKRKAMGITVNEHPRFTEYLRQAQQIGLGVTDPDKIRLVKVEA